MERSWILGLLLLGANAFAQGQSLTAVGPSPAPQSSLALAPVVGVNFTQLTNTQYKSDMGMSGGLLANLGGGSFQLEMGLVYNSFHQSAKYEATILDVEYRLRQEYLSLPLMGKFNLAGQPVRTVFVKGGVMPSFMVGHREEVEYRGLFSAKERLQDNPAMEKTVLFAVGGAGGVIALGKRTALAVEAVYLTSLKRISTTSGYNGQIEGMSINASLMISL